MSPSTVIAPSWASPMPPNVPAACIARTVDISRQVRRLWDRWCGLRDLDAVVGCVIHETCELPHERRQAGARRLVRWLDEIARQRGPDVVAALRHLPWVLARKEGEFAFKPSKEALDHPGAEVLQHEFWVVAEKIPTSLARSIQTLQLEGTRDVLEAIARCLTSSASAAAAATQTVYELLVDLMSDEQASEVWCAVARSTPVYRLFRNTDRGPHPMVSSQELFLGDQELKRDFGHVLYCFGTEDNLKKHIRRLYRKLGVNIRPSVGQLVGALSRIPSRVPKTQCSQISRRYADRISAGRLAETSRARPLGHEGAELRQDLRTVKWLLSRSRTRPPVAPVPRKPRKNSRRARFGKSKIDALA